MGLTGMVGSSVYAKYRSKIGTIALAAAFVLSIACIHNTRTCEDKKGYPDSREFVKFGYGISIALLVLICIIFALDLFFMVAKKVSPV